MTHSLLETDGYKFSMAEAGFPLRIETFYYAHRKGGPMVIPIDIKKFVEGLLPTPEPRDYEYLDHHEYEMGAGYRVAMNQLLKVDALPKGAIFFPHEPAFSVTGPSALVSWLEPLLLQINYRIQLATCALSDPARLDLHMTCDGQEGIAKETLDAVQIKDPVRVSLDPDAYYVSVLKTVTELVKLVEDPSRIFEVGLRSATCLGHHMIALLACRAAGVLKTSNVYGARVLGMEPVGTMGHEHVQRWGSDEKAFRAMRDRRPHRSSYLLDTFSTIPSGIPAAFRVMEEFPDRRDSIRYDSGDKIKQYRFAVAEARDRGIHPIHIIEDGLDHKLTKTFEEIRKAEGIAPEDQYYGYGGFIVAQRDQGHLTRDNVAATYKLSRTGPWDTMKFSDDSGKESIPGRPVVFRRIGTSGPIGIVGQADEECPEGYRLETGADTPSLTAENFQWHSDYRVTPSKATQEIARDFKKQVSINVESLG